MENTTILHKHDLCKKLSYPPKAHTKLYQKSPNKLPQTAKLLPQNCKITTKKQF